MSWAREGEFRRLLASSVKHLTKEGMETIVAMAVKDMAQVRCL